MEKEFDNAIAELMRRATQVDEDGDAAEEAADTMHLSQAVLNLTQARHCWLDAERKKTTAPNA